MIIGTLIILALLYLFIKWLAYVLSGQRDADLALWRVLK